MDNLDLIEREFRLLIRNTLERLIRKRTIFNFSQYNGLQLSLLIK